MRKYLLVIGLLMSIMLTGCGVEKKSESTLKMTPTPTGDWSVEYSSLFTVNSFEDSKSSEQKLPSEGNLFLIVELDVKNKSKRQNNLQLTSDDQIKYQSANGSQYSMQSDNALKGAIKTYFKSEGEHTGYVFFEIPKNDDPFLGKLIVNLKDGPKNLIIDLKN